jgi:hypothetical protein
MLTNLEKSKSFPGWVVWTAHERATEDKISGEKMIGPEIVGGALTASISRIFQNTLHFTTVAAKKKVKDPHSEKMIDIITPEYRLYTRDHFDPDGATFVKFKAVNRCTKPEMMPDYLIGKGPGDNILDFYEKMVEAGRKGAEEMKAAMAA